VLPHQTITSRTDIGDDLLGEVLLVLALLDVGPVEALHVALVEHRRPRTDLLELGPHLIEQSGLEDPRRLRGRVAILFEDVPAAKHQIIEARERDDIADLRRSRVGPLAQTERAHLRERPDRFGDPLADGDDAGDGRGADGPEADEENTELAAGRSDFDRSGHDEKLYHH
jgi:hypothetical protein